MIIIRKVIVAILKPHDNFKPLLKDENEECCICLCKLKKKDVLCELSCGHIFHEKCFQKWTKKTCPLCRKP